MTPDMKELPAELGALALRCEQATGPDRALDVGIKEALGHPWDHSADWGPRGSESPVAYPYTASLDAAMSLVPEGWWLNQLEEYNQRTWNAVLRGPRSDVQRLYAYARRSGASNGIATAALALCAAALRAHLQANPIPDVTPGTA